MFTHPALLREMTVTAEFLRRGGEVEWARRVVGAADQVRRLGWTEAGHQALRSLWDSDPSIESVTFGAEHERHLGGPVQSAQANERLSRHRAKLTDLAQQRLAQSPAPGPRLRSPDLP